MKHIIMVVVLVVIVGAVFAVGNFSNTNRDPGLAASLIALVKRRAVDPVKPLFRDSDKDGYGDVNAPSRGTTDPAWAWVSNSSDCNDTDATLFQMVSKLGRDQDQDRYYTGSLKSVCVGNGLSDGFGAWYTVDKSNWIMSKTALGGRDCDDRNPKKYPGKGC